MQQTNKYKNVLVISEYYPNPVRPAFGIFVKQQTFYNQQHSQNTVIAPVRVFPHVGLWQNYQQPGEFATQWKAWMAGLSHIPDQATTNDITVHYPRYTSPPKQIAHSLWGYFAYIFIAPLLHQIHKKKAFDLIHAHYATPAGVIALLAQRWMKVPIVLSIHGGDITFTAKQNQLGRRVTAHVFDKVDAIIAQSTWTREKIIEYGGTPSKTKIIRLGAIPPQSVTEAKSALIDKQVITILSVGYLVKRKGHADVLRAVARLVQNGYAIRYVIVGDGPEGQNLQGLARELEISHLVSFEGYKTHDEVWTYFNECDIFVLPSWDEAFGVVYIEALSMGKSVIGCHGQGGPEDLKQLGDCVELVTPQDVEGLTQTLQRLCDNPERRQRMGQTGRQIVAESFNWEKNAWGVAALYEQVIRDYHYAHKAQSQSKMAAHQFSPSSEQSTLPETSTKSWHWRSTGK